MCHVDKIPPTENIFCYKFYKLTRRIVVMSSKTLPIIIAALTLFTCKGDDNLLCDTDSWNIIEGTWNPLDDCALITTDFGAGNIVWFGSSDGKTPDSRYDRDIFEFTVTLSVFGNNGDAGVMFRCGEASTTNDEGPSYYVGISAGKGGVMFGILDDGWTQKKWKSYDVGTDDHELTIKGSGNSYRVYLDGTYVTKAKLSNFNSGGIGVRSYKTMATYSSVTFSYPTMSPTVDPTLSPTNPPTLSPTPRPTTANPTTPSPTHPGEIECGSHETGPYNGKPMRFEVRMPFDGDMTVDLSASDFNISEIIAYDSNQNHLEDSDPSAAMLTLNNLSHGGDYWFNITGIDGVTTGTYDIMIECTSDAPTKSPTTVPTKSPTVSPTVDPTVHPTPDPTKNPTTNPTTSPTAKPTFNPSSSPTTPAPTHPGELICGSHTNGDYSGKPVLVEVRMPFDGDMKMDLSGSDFNISSIIAYDSSHNQLADSDSSASMLTLNDLVHGDDYSFEITGVDGVTSGTFDIVIECTSDAPTRSPSMEPTESPITDPTWSPTVDPTTEAEAMVVDNFTFNWTLTMIIFGSLLSVPACTFCLAHCLPKSCYKPKVYSEPFV